MSLVNEALGEIFLGLYVTAVFRSKHYTHFVIGMSHLVGQSKPGASDNLSQITGRIFKSVTLLVLCQPASLVAISVLAGYG